MAHRRADSGTDSLAGSSRISGAGAPGRLRYFCWERHKTIAEADGLAKYAAAEDMLAQFRRDRLLRDAGYKVVHFTWRELFDTPALVIFRVRKAQADPTPY